MMMKEFTERTGYTPDEVEYHYIEESYYDFEGNKDEFCKLWKAEYRSGAWERELRLRKAQDFALEELKAKIAEQDESLVWYRQQFDKYMALQKESTRKDDLIAQYKERAKLEKRENNFRVVSTAD